MRGVTLGIGPDWDECAQYAAAAMSRHTGLECVVLSDWPTPEPLAHAYWAKLWVQDVLPDEDLMLFDADMICQRDWSPKELLADHDLAWCRDTSPQIPAECVRLGLDPMRYGNTGMILIRRGCDLLQAARRYYPSRFVGRWPEQSAMNLVVQHSAGGPKVGILDQQYNFIVRRYQHQGAVSGRYGATNLHFVGLRGSEGVREIQQSMGVY